MRFGIDVHRVADTKKKFFAIFTKRAIEKGHEVHIITGSQRTSEIEAELKEYGIQYTHFFSIADSLLAEGCAVSWKDKDNPFFDDVYWNDAKARYCESQKIDIHFDDSREYGKHFKTLYMRII
jgi:hypothetical protein